MSGSHPPPLGPAAADAAAGALLGVGTLAAVGPVAPAIAAAFGRRTKVRRRHAEPSLGNKTLTCSSRSERRGICVQSKWNV